MTPATTHEAPAIPAVPVDAAASFGILHLVSGPDGRTHVEEMDPRQPTERLPYLYRAKATVVSVLEYAAGQEFRWRTATSVGPRLLIQLRGLSLLIVEGGRGAGASHHPLAPGSIVLDEDVGGRMHRCKVLENESAILMQVELASSPGVAK